MRALKLSGLFALALFAAVGSAPTLSQEASPIVDDGPITFTLIEHADHVTKVDLGESGTSPGDLTVWGPDPLFDEANTTDTGALTHGSCQALNAAGDNHCIETIVFPNGSTLEIQGIQTGDGSPSLTTIIGGSGDYLGAYGTLHVDASVDFLLWTKTFEIHLP